MDAKQLWKESTTPIFAVVDENGLNIANGQVRQQGDNWLYVDDVDGWSIITDADVKHLRLIPTVEYSE